MTRRRAVFLDRDGVLNAVLLRDDRPHPPEELDQIIVLPRVTRACRLLSEAGFLLIIVTNQPDIARGATTRAKVDAINARLMDEIKIDDVRVCPHDDADGCECRKPLPGLLIQAAADHKIDLQASFMVGDRWRDIEAGRAAGCRTVWIWSDYAEESGSRADAVASELFEACKFILPNPSSSFES